MAWSVKPRQAYPAKDGMRKIKSVLTNDIFKRKMLHTHEQKSSSKDEPVRRGRTEIKEPDQEMRQSISNYPELEAPVMVPASQRETVRGNKKYSYLPNTVKKPQIKSLIRWRACPSSVSAMNSDGSSNVRSRTTARSGSVNA